MATSTGSENNSRKSKEMSELNDSEFARIGISLWLNNKPHEAEEHFKRRKSSLQVEAGSTFLSFMNAIISWETNKIEESQKMLRDLEKHCTSDNGWLKTVRVKLFGTSAPAKTLAQTLEEQIILADSQLCISILTGLTQDIGGMMKAGWSLRKAWKLYQTSYSQISDLYRQTFQLNLHKSSIRKHDGPNRKEWNKDKCRESSSSKDEKDEIQPYPSPNDSPSHCYDIPFPIDDTKTNTNNKNGFNLENVASTSRQASAPTKMPKSYTTTFSDTIQQQSTKISRPSSDLYQTNSAHVNSRLNRNSSLAADDDEDDDDDVEMSNNGYKQSVPTSYSMNEFAETLEHSMSAYHQRPYHNNYHYRHNGEISKDDLKRLMGAASFGYGLFQLSVSLLPPNLLKLISFFGFEGDRRIGITCLKHSRQSEDMRAPLATLALLWYYTIITPFFALDGTNLDSEIEEANLLLEEAQESFKDAALFLFFRGRMERLKSNISEAVNAYETSHNVSVQREIKLLCLHEIGWCRLIQLNFGKAMEHFDELKQHSQFSKSFYAYMMTICQAAYGRMENLVQARDEIYGFISSSYLKDFWDEFVFDQTPNAVYLQDSQIEKYILRRVSKLPVEEVECEKFEQIYWKFLVYEMLIMWNAINSCSEETLKVIMEDCKKPRDSLNEPMKGLAKLVLATCHSCLKNYDEAIIAYRECIEQRGELLESDLHISAFAYFELAMLLLKHRDDKVEARRLLLYIQNHFKNYDFENRLGIRVHSVLKGLT